ncbi:class I SAM-dependent methyltransferase [Herbiconiux sp. L3-i23]|uniref:class I SAM-dependent methyltransferase n=1 Tax=Herbiconiux sp. L3-i23 TaxID=2905871 RepID=UPI0020468535|nr:class I SAM-dependent methyltransferase [Herbiconiux sp. L3-i23]BDI24034.1 hypothetical protein L3i23_28100 [Herbiconiux sp. L3-i23]
MTAELSGPAQSAADWFVCPICGRDLAAIAPSTLGCPTGHSFEVSRRGYFALASGSSGLMRSEPADALDAIDRRWSADRAPVLEALDAATPTATGRRVLDVGSDLGHALSRVLGGRPGWRALHAGPSPAGVARTIANAGCDGLLLDPIRPWPIRDGAADVALAVGGVPSPVELHRILAPGGVLVTAIDGGDVDPAQVIDDLFPWFEHDQTRSVSGGVVLRLRRRRRVWH